MKIECGLIYILMLCCLSCTDKSKHYTQCTEFKLEDGKKIQVSQLIGKPLNFDIDVNKPVRLFSCDSVLIVNNMNTEQLLDIYNLNDNKKICSNISVGNASNELMIISKIQRVDSSLLLFDQMKGKLFEYSISNFCTEQPEVLSVTELETAANNVVKLASGNMLATTFNEEGKRFSLFNSQGKLLKSMGEYPSYNEGLTMYEKMESFICDMALNKSGVVLAYKRTDLIEFYDIEGNLKKRVHGPDHFFPAVKQKSKGEEIRLANKEGQSRDAYFYPTVYNDEIWVLYSGKYYNNTTPIYLNNILFVFDLDGVLLRQYNLNIPIFTFAINAERKKLYGITDDPEMQIIEFDMYFS